MDGFTTVMVEERTVTYCYLELPFYAKEVDVCEEHRANSACASIYIIQNLMKNCFIIFLIYKITMLFVTLHICGVKVFVTHPNCLLVENTSFACFVNCSVFFFFKDNCKL